MSSEWRELPLGECLLKVVDNRGKTPPLAESKTPYGLIEVNALVGSDKAPNYSAVRKFVSAETYSSWFRSGHPVSGDLLFSTVGSVAEVALFNGGSGCIAQNIVGLRPNTEIILPNYLYYALVNPVMQLKLKTLDISSVQPSIKVPHLLAAKIQVPPFHLQERIGDILESLDDRITLLRETNATLEAIAQALFKSWFVDFDPVRANIAAKNQPEGAVQGSTSAAQGGMPAAALDSATAALFPDSFEESELGLVPRGWRVAPLGSVCCYLSRGISPKYLEAGGILVLNQKCIRDFSVDYGKGRRHDLLQRKIDGRELAFGDVLVNSTGVGTLGRIAQVLQLPEAAIVDSHVTVVRAGAALSWPYLGQFMARKQPEIEAMGEGSTGQTELSRTKLAGVSILVPSTTILSKFDEAVIPLKKRIAINESKAQTLASLRDTLLPRLISGQLRLPEAEAAVEEVL